jgi:hypothetical protein
MECPMCKYQFCWYCQDAFYTEYHYNQTDCPMRIILFYSIISVLGLSTIAKMYKSFTIVNNVAVTLFSCASFIGEYLKYIGLIAL